MLTPKLWQSLTDYSHQRGMSRSACVEHIAREFLEQNGFLHPITPEGAKPAPVPQEITAEMIAEAVEIVRVAHAKTLKKR